MSPSSPTWPMEKVPDAMKRGELDAMTVWEPEIQNAQDVLGADAIEFQDRSVYRELFNLNTTAENLANPAMRAQIVAFVRSLIKASAHIRREPQDVWPLVAKSRGYDAALIRACGITRAIPARWSATCWMCWSKRKCGWRRSAIARRARGPSSPRSSMTSVLKEALEQERAEERAATTSAAPPTAAVSRSRGEEAIRSIKRLQHAYTHYIEAAQPGELAKLFARNASRSPGGVFTGGVGQLNTVLFFRR